jgi:hypothetical protein
MNFHDENGHEYVTPYNVFEAIHGAYDPDASPVVIFSNWMREEKAEYLKQFPEAARNQIDGHFYDPELERFFRWISSRGRTK